MSNNRPNPETGPRRTSRRDLLKLSAGMSAGAALGANLGEPNRAEAAQGATGATLAPNYYPLRVFTPQLSIRGKLAVVTGASRGLGRAVANALTNQGVAVIGTSRHPSEVPNRPSYPLLKLDVVDPDSVASFVEDLRAHRLFRNRGRLDILCNNAGRIVVGPIIPASPRHMERYLEQRELGTRTNYLGHVVVTNSVLPLMSRQAYSRIIFTVSVNAYTSLAQHPFGSMLEVYSSAKAALLAYANNLDTTMRLARSSIRVSTVNPYFMRTAGFTHPNPIYTLPVGREGLSPTDDVFNAAVKVGRQMAGNALPPEMVGETYAQLLTMNDPVRNVVVASPDEPWATKGGNTLIESQLVAENDLSAVPFA